MTSLLGIGLKPGLVIWRIENFELALVDTAHHGQFYTGDSYVILRTKTSGSTTTGAPTTTTTAAATVPVPAPAPSAMTNNAPVSVVVSVSQSASRAFPCPYCATPYAYASQAGLRRHIAKCH